MKRTYLSGVTVATALVAGGYALAHEAQHLQGLRSCNTESQIDEALADIAAGLSPRRAADRANPATRLVCTNVVDDIGHPDCPPRGARRPRAPLVKYRGALLGAPVGHAVRPVAPEFALYFQTPQRVAGAAAERRT